MLNGIGGILYDLGLVGSTWAAEMAVWGARVGLYRDYYEGRHRTYLTDKMRALLRSSGFSDNYCDLVVNAAAARLMLRGVDPANAQSDAEAERLAEFAAAVFDEARFDALQIDLHEAALRDGDVFVLVGWDNVENLPTLSLELAYDGAEGMIPVYDRTRSRLVAAVKIWADVEGVDDVWRANLYFADRVVKYVSRNDDDLRVIEEAAWLGGAVPVVHFQNRRGARDIIGVSELSQMIPLQDALNRTLISMIMAGELSAFQIRVARGFDPPDTVEPGMWVVIGADGLDKDMIADAATLEGGDIVPFINQCEFLIDQIATVTSTPIPAQMGGAQSSGEALKERQTALISKVERAQTKLGNGWEDMVWMAVMVNNAYGAQNLPVVRWSARWKDAATRGANEVIAAAVAVKDSVSTREFLRIVGRVFDWDEAKIDMILAERRDEAAANIAQLTGDLPGFDNFGI